MPTIEIELKTKPISMNTFFARSHWSARNELAKNYHFAFGAAIKEYQDKNNIKYGSDSMRIKSECKMEFYYPRAWKMDLDNLSAMEKLIIDSLKDFAVKGLNIWNIFGDDKIIVEIKKSFHLSDKILIYVTGAGSSEHHKLEVKI